MDAWYAVHTQARMEQWARSNLWERGFEVYLPLYRKLRRHARKTERVSAALFPRYLFVRADLSAGHKPRIRSCPGVDNLVAFGNRPAAIRDAIIAEIRSREGEDGYVDLRDVDRMRAGEPLRVVDGALCEHVGLFQCLDDKQRVVILLQLLGREVKVRLSADQVSRA